MASSLAAFSAGVRPGRLDPRAVEVMAEAGIDISGQRPKHVGDLNDVSFDYVIAVCDDAYESCPVFPGHAKIIRRAFDDPPRLARDATSNEEQLRPYRRVRDEIREFVSSFPRP